jgi:hypothetical protein
MIGIIERLRLGEGTSPDHLLLLEAADTIEKFQGALSLTEDNLSRLMAAKHHDKVLMGPWRSEVLRVLKEAGYGPKNSEPDPTCTKCGWYVTPGEDCDRCGFTAAKTGKQGDLT